MLVAELAKLDEVLAQYDAAEAALKKMFQNSVSLEAWVTKSMGESPNLRRRSTSAARADRRLRKS